MRADKPPKAYSVLSRPFFVTSGGGRWGLVRNSGYVTTGGRSPGGRIGVGEGEVGEEAAAAEAEAGC